MNGVFRWVLVVALVGAGVAAAQPLLPAGPPPQRPPFSPYLNLLRGGNSPALNYYGLVRPEQQFRQSINGLQGVVDANQQAIGTLQADPQRGGMLATGHQAVFLNYGGYFLNMGGSGSPSFASPGRGRAGGQAMGGVGGSPSGGVGGVPLPRR